MIGMIGDKRPVVMDEEKGIPGGVATLGADGKVPAGQLPLDDAEDNGLTAGQDGLHMRRPSNPNLLDNWYFADPINQRGLMEYYSDNSQYTIDRWRTDNSKVKFELIEGQYIRMTRMDATISHFFQIPDPALEKDLIGKTVTLSVMTPEGVFWKDYAIQAGSIGINFITLGTKHIAATITKNENRINIMFTARGYAGAGAGDFVELIAAKLELGDHQTLAHKEPRTNYGDTLPAGVVDAGDGEVWVLNDPPPNRQQELAKCQRYAIKVGGTYGYRATQIAPNVIDFPINTPVTLRTNPVMTDSDKQKLHVYTMDNSEITGCTFTFHSAGENNTGFIVRATKPGHNVTDARLRCNAADTVIFSADL